MFRLNWNSYVERRLAVVLLMVACMAQYGFAVGFVDDRPYGVVVLLMMDPRFARDGHRGQRGA